MKTRPSLYKTLLAGCALACVALACGTSASQPEDPGLGATQTALAATQAAVLATATPHPTATSEPPTATPRPPTPTPDPRGPINFNRFSSGDEVYRTEFDLGEWEDEWLDLAISFDNRSIDSKISDVSMGDGTLLVSLKDTWQQVYVFNENAYVPRDVPIYIEAEVDNLGPTRNNNISILCRVSPEGWYEFSISSSGLWWIWRYTPQQGYISLTNGGLQNYDQSITSHTLGASCIDDRLTLYVDGVQPRNAQIRDATLREGMVGVAVFVANVQNVNVEFDYFLLSIP